MDKPKSVPQGDPEQSERFLDLANKMDRDASNQDLKASVARLAKVAPEPRRKVGKQTGKTGRSR